MTRLSEEQVIIAQLQGSTESTSQFLKTPFGSFKKFLIAIKASTTANKRVPPFIRERKSGRSQENAEKKEAPSMAEMHVGSTKNRQNSPTFAPQDQHFCIMVFPPQPRDKER
nr:hypothetical protein ZEAMMB73_Zm00001d039203 [Ipomoea batatas]GMD28799.1 hypothetical protein ZEAMMB73_Zm00001d039203 [Ipomoea batatas]